MRHVRFSAAISLDGFIARRDGSFDWIPGDPDIDMSALFAGFDTVLMGRASYESARDHGGMPGLETIVFSKTLRPEDAPGVTVERDPAEAVARLRSRPGKDLWLFGGGVLFASFLELGLVDSVQLAYVPIVLGAGLPLVAAPAPSLPLRLAQHRVYPKSGMVLLDYERVT